MLHKAIDIMSLDSIVCILWMTVSKAVGVIVGCECGCYDIYVSMMQIQEDARNS